MVARKREVLEMQTTSETRDIQREKFFLRLKSKLRQKPARLERMVLESLEGLIDMPEDYETDEEQELWLENEKLKALARRERLSNCIKIDAAAELLGVNVPALYMRLQRGTLLGFKEGKEYFIPRWQFDLGSDNQMIAGFDHVLAHLRESSDNSDTFRNKILWLTRASALFDGATPIEALKQGSLASVMDYLMSIGGGQR